MLTVADVMTTELFTLSPDDSLKTARDLMRAARIRHLPIVTPDGKFVGLLTQRDLLKASVSYFADIQAELRDEIEAGIPVQEVMATEVLTVPPHLAITQAGELLLAHKFGSLPVLENEKLLGILTEADFVKLCMALLEQGNAQ